MLEASRLARREPALPPGGDGAVSVLPAASRFSLRVKGVEDGVAFLTLPINRCALSDDRLLARLGPDEWLIIGPEADTEALAAEMANDLGGRFHALVDVSHRSVGFEVSGRGAVDIVNAGCPLDLHPSAFPPGSATRTLLGKAEIILFRPGDEPVFRIECWRSFATYVHTFLLEAARDV